MSDFLFIYILTKVYLKNIYIMSEIVKKLSEAKRNCLLPSEVMDYIVSKSISIRDELSKDNLKANNLSTNIDRDELHNHLQKKLWLNFVHEELQKDNEWFKKKVENILSNLPEKLKKNKAIHDIFYDDKWNIYLEKFIKLMTYKFWSNHSYLSKYADKIYDNSKTAYFFSNKIYKDKKTGYIMKIEWSWVVFVYNLYKLSTKWKTVILLTDEKTQNEILSNDWYIFILNPKNDNNQLTGHIIGKWFTDPLTINNFESWSEGIKSISYYWENREILTIDEYGKDKFEATLAKKSDWTREINKIEEFKEIKLTSFDNIDSQKIITKTKKLNFIDQLRHKFNIKF